jgi:hypothetical protein
MTATGNLGQAQAHSQPPLAVTPPGSSVPSFRAKRPFLQSSRHTGEVAEGRRGKPQAKPFPIQIALNFGGAEVGRAASPLRPYGAPPRVTGEEKNEVTP